MVNLGRIYFKHGYWAIMEEVNMDMLFFVTIEIVFPSLSWSGFETKTESQLQFSMGFSRIDVWMNFFPLLSFLESCYGT